MWAGIDFGTSNSAVAIWDGDAVKRIPLGASSEGIPTSVFFDEEEKKMLIGERANEALVEGYDGRYMRSLKSVLGTSLMHERQLLLGKGRNFYDIISAFLIEIKKRTEEQLGQELEGAVAGCPVTFMGERADALDDLRECFYLAGFKDVEFITEPEAVAYAYNDNIKANEYGLVVDIGGGTSDFTVFKCRDEAVNRGSFGHIDVIASHGVDIGGTHFDHRINYKYFMPHLGKGQLLKLAFSNEELSAPNKFFHDLSDWAKIPFSYTHENIKLVKEMEKQAVVPQAFKRLLRVLEDRSGHDLAFTAEDAKIALNKYEKDQTVSLGFIERDLSFGINVDDFNQSMEIFEENILNGINDCIKLSGLSHHDINNVILVGGSSSMSFVKNAIAQTLPHAHVRQEAIFSAISDGLAIRSAAYS